MSLGVKIRAAGRGPKWMMPPCRFPSRASFVDPTKWIGAWNFSDAGCTNIVAGANGSAFTYVPVVQSQIISFRADSGYLNSSSFGQDADPGYSTGRGSQLTGIDISNGFSLGGWVKYNMTPFGTEQWLDLLFGSTFPFRISFGHAGGPVAPFRVDDVACGNPRGNYAWDGAAAGVSHFFAVVAQVAASTWTITRYKDGMVMSVDTGIPRPVSGAVDMFACDLNTFYDNNALNMDNLWLTKEILSASAIAVLATDSMPDPAGNLI